MLQVRVQQKVLVKALTKVNHACAKKSTLPVLEHVLLSVKGGIFTVQTTNLGVGMRIEMETDIEVEVVSAGEEYGVSVPCKMLLKMAKSMPKDGILSIEETRKGEGKDLKIKVTMKDDVRGFELMGIDGGEFVKMNWPTKDSKAVFSIPADVLLAGLGKAKPFMETDDSRPILNGLQIVSAARKTNNLHFAGANGFMLASVPLTAVIGKKPLDVVLGKGAVEVLCKLLPKTEDMVIVYQDDNGLYFVVDGMSIMGQTVESTFPDYKTIIPTTHNFLATLDAGEFLDELKRATAIHVKNVGSIRLELADSNVMVADSSVMVTAENSDGVGFSATIKAEGCEIDDMESLIALDVQMAIKMLSPVAFAKGDKVTISWEIQKRGSRVFANPIVLENPTKDDGAKYVLMPMNLGR